MLKRAAILLGSVSTVVLAGSGTALADDVWGGVECSQTSYSGCQLGAGQGGFPGQSPSRPQHPGSGNHAGGGSDSQAPERPSGDSIVGDDPNLADCRYVPSDYRPPSEGTTTIAHHPPSQGGAITVTPVGFHAVPAARVRPAQQPGGSQGGSWYVYQCAGEGWADGLYRSPIWIPHGQAPVPSPEQLAQQAYNQLRLPSMRIHANPARTQLVNLPTWLWLDRQDWHLQTATASAPGVSVTARATPQSVTWSMGDGIAVTCPGAGVPFPTGTDPRATSPDCGHVYHRSSQGQPKGTFAVSATVHWRIDWSGADQSGSFPDLTTTSNAAFNVAESQALNTPR